MFIIKHKIQFDQQLVNIRKFSLKDVFFHTFEMWVSLKKDSL